MLAEYKYPFPAKLRNRIFSWLLGITFAFLSSTALGETYTVVTSDDGVIFTSCDLEFVCPTFRAAIVATNSTEEADTINFDIPDGDVHTITLVDILPPITSKLHINGYSQPGATMNTGSTLTGLNTQLKIELDGSNLQTGFFTYAGLEINADGCIIEGLVIINFISRGIMLIESNNNIIRGNFIGVEADGVTAARNGVGLAIRDSGSNQVGEPPYAEGRNLISGNLFDGITIAGALSTNNKIMSNLIGTDKSGLVGLGNGIRGILLTSEVGMDSYPTNNVIGGTDENYRNIISGNLGPGIHILRGDSNTVSANYIGVNVTGDERLANGATGIFIVEGSNNKIGGSGLSEGNVISGNLGAGIEINAGWVADDPEIGGLLQRDATGNLIYGNYIGTDQSGLEPIPNALGGILISSSNENAFKVEDTFIGNVAVADSGNLISGNDGPGIQLDGENTLKTIVQRNRIGLSGNDTTPLGNKTHGILIRAGSSENVIGSKFEPDEEEAENIIAFNGGGRFALAFPFVEYNGVGLKEFGHGVFVEKGTKNTIRLNSIYLNEGRAIDLGEDYTFTVNDPSNKDLFIFDSDTGSNDLQNFPVAVIVNFDGNKFIRWELNHKAGTAVNPLPFKLDFYSNNEPDPSGFGEGRRYLSTFTISNDAGSNRTQINSNVSFSVHNISATATDSEGNTSEFSMVDTDGDAIADAWETPGMGIDVNEDGKPDLNLSDYGASLNHRDIFLEVDGMQDRLPGVITKELVFAAFANAPVDNPDGTSGIALHFMAGGEIIPKETWRNADDNLDWPSAFDRIKNGPAGGDFSQGRFGTLTDRASTNWPFIRAAKQLVVHYVFMADLFEGIENGMEDIASGAAESGGGMGGNDIYLALGDNVLPGGSIEDRAEGIMHELGHNLGLGHGGRNRLWADNTNYKPNYHSLMNYLWEIEADWMSETDVNANGVFDSEEEYDYNNNGKFDNVYRLDFSRVAYGPYGVPPDEKIFLDETNLNETAGIGGQVDTWVLIGPNSNPSHIVLEQGGVDWNHDGDALDTVVNQLGINNPEDSDTPVADILVAREDWNLLRYYFLESPDMHKSKHTISADPELNYNDILELNSLGIGSGILRFKYQTFNANESSGSAIITITRGGGTVGTVTVDYATVDGSAIANADFTPVSGTLTFLKGEYLQTFAVPIIQDGLEEGTESLQLQLSNPTGGGFIFSGEETSQLQIEDDDSAGTLQFATSYLDILETDGIIDIEVTRTKGVEGAVTVDYSTIDSTATGGLDYLPASGTLNFAPGQATAIINVTILPDLLEEITELLLLNLFNPTGSSTLGNISSTEINIINAPVTAGTLQFDSSDYEVVEDSATVELTVSRSGSTTGAVSVDYASSNGTATAGEDFSAVAGTLNFSDGQASASFNVSILDDADDEGNEIFVLTLSNATGGAGINSPPQANVHIIDDEGAGTIQFSAATYSVSEDVGDVIIEVSRTGSDAGEVSIDYATSNDSAMAGSDYSSTSGTLNFSDGQSSASFSISVVDDSNGEFDESLLLGLSNPGGGAQLGMVSMASLEIVDNEAPVVVINVNDSGPGSLRAAILEANSRISSSDRITFDIPGVGVKRIELMSALPTITTAVIIDGYSQPGAQANTSVVGSNAKLLIELGVTTGMNMMTITASNSTIRGLAFDSNYHRDSGEEIRTGGMTLEKGASNNHITGNFIGPRAHGFCVGTRRSGGGIRVYSKVGDIRNTIGGFLLAERNIIGCGGSISAGPGTGVFGNLIGVGIDGVTSIESSEGDGVTFLQSSKYGISAAGPGTEIGRVEPGWGNVIAFHGRGGVQVNPFGVSGNVSIRGNSIYSNTRLDDVLVNGRRFVGGIETNNSPWDVYDVTESDRAQNAPILNSAITGTAGTIITGLLFSTPDSTFILDFYLNTNAHVSGYGEGKKYLGSTSVVTDADGHVDFSFSIANGIPQGQLVTATAKYADRGTSTFSARIAVGDVLESPFVVNSDDDEDDGSCSAFHCSLREAIIAANNHPGPDSIHFNIETGLQTISVRFSLPTVLESVSIDGTTQPGFAGMPLIELQGKYKFGTQDRVTPGGLHIYGSDTLVHGLIINLFAYGVILDGDGNHRLIGNFIGLDNMGVSDRGNNSGVRVMSKGNLIGGRTPEERNIISGNDFAGIYVARLDTRIEGNYIGPDVTGMISVGAQHPGIDVVISSGEFGHTIIGGLAPGAGNVISGNLDGVEASNNTVIQGNLIGMNADCSAALSNIWFGINSDGGSSNYNGQPGSLIGGLDPAARNVISGNGSNGIEIDNGSGGRIQGNYIGVGCDGTTLFENSRHGIRLRGVSDIEVGGTKPGAENIIAGNGEAGVAIIVGFGPRGNIGSANQILGNAIFANQELGIDIGDDGPDTNDQGDADSGLNSLQNYPVITSAQSSALNTLVSGTLNSAAEHSFRLEFFANATGDSSGFGEGEQFLGSRSVVTDAEGNTSFSATFLEFVPVGASITATATDADGNTSEFSAGFVVEVATSTPPVARDDAAVTEAVTAVTLDILANDEGFDGDLESGSVIVINIPSNGSTQIDTATGSITYTPMAAFSGIDYFGYTVEDNLGAESNIATVSITVLPPSKFSIGGDVNGLTGAGLVLQNNLDDDLAIDADGDFTFTIPLDDGSAYAVTVLTQPTVPSQICSVASGSGTLAGLDITDVIVTCVSADGGIFADSFEDGL